MINNSERILRLAEVESIVGLKKTKIYEMIASGSFPSPLRIGRKAVRWEESKIKEWVQNITNQTPEKNTDERFLNVEIQTIRIERDRRPEWVWKKKICPIRSRLDALVYCLGSECAFWTRSIDNIGFCSR